MLEYSTENRSARRRWPSTQLRVDLDRIALPAGVCRWPAPDAAAGARSAAPGARAWTGRPAISISVCSTRRSPAGVTVSLANACCSCRYSRDMWMPRALASRRSTDDIDRRRHRDRVARRRWPRAAAGRCSTCRPSPADARAAAASKATSGSAAGLVGSADVTGLIRGRRRGSKWHGHCTGPARQGLPAALERTGSGRRP